MPQKPLILDPEFVSFGAFVLDIKTGELRRGGCLVPLRPLASKCLRLLVERAGRLVTLDELRQELWSTTVVDWRAGIHQTISQIRKALEDHDHRMVESVNRQGYRFLQPVTPLSNSKIDVSAGRFQTTHVFAAGFVTPITLLSMFLIWCGSFA